MAQETITTPLVADWFGWDEVGANLLFTAAGVATAACAVLMSFLAAPRQKADGGTTQLVSDRALLGGSLLLGLIGWATLVPPAAWGAASADGGADEQMSLVQFGTGFTMVTVAFPIGRGVVLALVGKLLGDGPQGGWMGLIFAFGAIARMLGPFWAVTGYHYFGAMAVFGSTSALYALSLLLTHEHWSTLQVGAEGDGGKGGGAGGSEGSGEAEHQPDRPSSASSSPTLSRLDFAGMMSAQMSGPPRSRNGSRRSSPLAATADPPTRDSAYAPPLLLLPSVIDVAVPSSSGLPSALPTAASERPEHPPPAAAPQQPLSRFGLLPDGWPPGS